MTLSRDAVADPAQAPGTVNELGEVCLRLSHSEPRLRGGDALLVLALAPIIGWGLLAAVRFVFTLGELW